MNSMLRLICLSCTFIFLMACESSNTSTANKEKAVISEEPAKLILVSGVTGRQTVIRESMKNRHDYYQILHVQPDAPREIIRS
jgi:hypothetical protein